MRAVFADTSYWIAASDRKDSWAAVAASAEYALANTILITTDEILVEYLAAFSGAGPKARQRSSSYVRRLFSRRDVSVVPQSRESFLDGLSLYETRPDKGYSLTDCISMCTMRAQGIREVLTTDRHFAQEGFIVLMQRPVS
jgi:predicted nucleic acid-binding protein